MLFTEVRPFAGADHQPFRLAGGHPAALLVHGFPGTPAELRTLGTSLHTAGWTVEGILLPGFGVEIGTLGERRYGEWVDATRRALIELQRVHSPVMLVGYSMGGAVALQAAAEVRPDSLVLLAPFWQFGPLWQHVAWPAVRLVVRQFRPFRHANLDDPKLRHRLSSLLPGLDLEDPQVLSSLRDLRVPTTVLDQLSRVGRRAYRVAPRAQLPTLVLQGTRDPVVRPDQTRRLLRRLPGPLRYVEVDSAHGIVERGNGCWRDVEQAVLQFAAATARPR